VRHVFQPFVAGNIAELGGGGESESRGYSLSLMPRSKPPQIKENMDHAGREGRCQGIFYRYPSEAATFHDLSICVTPGLEGDLKRGAKTGRHDDVDESTTGY